MLDAMLGDEMGDISRSVDGLCATAVNRAVDEMFDAVLDRLVYQVLALRLFGCVSNSSLRRVHILAIRITGRIQNRSLVRTWTLNTPQIEVEVRL